MREFQSVDFSAYQSSRGVYLLDVCLQALNYIGSRVKVRRLRDGSFVKKSKVDEAREVLQATVLSHVPVSFCHLSFRY
jgi:hypothetical protein